MADLTKEYFDKNLGSLATKTDLKELVSKADLDKQVKLLATKSDLKDLASKTDLVALATKEDLSEGLEGLAVIVNTAFDKQNAYLETKFAEITALTKLRERLDDHERKFRQLERTLNVKF